MILKMDLEEISVSVCESGGESLGVRKSGGQGPLARAVPCSCSKLRRNNEIRAVASLCCWVVRATN